MARILLIDDEALVREELGELLADEGYKVTCAADGDEALTRFRQDRPDMVITDVRMPRGDGISLAQTLRKESPATPITVITGHGNEALAIAALRAGVTDFLKKPVQLDALLAAVQRMLAVVEARGKHAELPDAIDVCESATTYALGNDLSLIPGFVDYLLTTFELAPEVAAYGELSLALRELLVNAIEHGNLALSYLDKSQELASGGLEQTLAQRAEDSAYASRRLAVTARKRPKLIEVEIADEGDGFDWRNLPDPTDPSLLFEEHGRGILLARMSVDELIFNHTGNVVTVRKSVSDD